jgi:hypothetical protein
MEYLIDSPSFQGKYSKDEIQTLINEKKIGKNTKIWSSEWNEWRSIQNTDFDLSNSNFAVQSDLPENMFLSIAKYLNLLDNGHFFRKPFSWLYIIFAVLNLLFPIYIFYSAVDREIFDAPAKYFIVFIIQWLVIVFVSWISFQLWWDRKSKVISISSEGNEFVATPVIAHLIQTYGEWFGTWIGIVGFSGALLVNLFLGNDLYYLSDLGIIQTDFIYMILMPVYGFLIIVASRFLAEQFRALSSIANNTRKK